MEYQFQHGTTKIVLHEATNRRRDLSRRIADKLMDQDVSARTVTEFAAIVARTKSVENGWQPPSPYAPKEELIVALNQWLDEVKTDLTDRWLEAIFDGNADPVTSPVPLSEGADPN